MVICLAVVALAASAHAAELVVSSETAPAGGTVQIKFFLSAPVAAGKTQLRAALDPKFFAATVYASVFNSTGAIGRLMPVEDGAVRVDFAFADGSGAANGYPIVAITATLRDGLADGVATEVTASISGVPVDRVVSGRVVVGRTAFIRQVAPASARLDAGDVLSIEGGGFLPEAQVEMEGVVVRESRWISPDRLDAVLGGPAEILGNRVTVRMPGTEPVEYFPSPRVGPGGGSPLVPLPIEEFVAAETEDLSRGLGWITVHNPNHDAAEVAIQTTSIGQYSIARQELITLPAGEARSLSWSSGMGAGRARVLSSLPIRAVVVITEALFVGGPRPRFGVFGFGRIDMPPLRADVSPSRVDVEWNRGLPRPARGRLAITGVERFILESTGGDWLSADPDAAPGAFRMDPSGLSPGIHRGFLVVTPVASYQQVAPVYVPVTLTVYGQPNMLATCCAEFRDTDPLAAQTISLPGELNAQVFEVHVRTYSGGDWLSATARGASVSIAVNPRGLRPGRYGGHVVVSDADSIVYMRSRFR